MPRPSRWPERIEMYVTRAQSDALTAYAMREGITVSALVRRALDAEIERLSTPAPQRN
jgi:post-segregation antitoxin (ccd killing protein)